MPISYTQSAAVQYHDTGDVYYETCLTPTIPDYLMKEKSRGTIKQMLDDETMVIHDFTFSTPHIISIYYHTKTMKKIKTASYQLKPINADAKAFGPDVEVPSMENCEWYSDFFVANKEWMEYMNYE